MIQAFLEKLTIHGLEFFKKYYGAYRGEVLRNDDPEERGRIQAIVPSVGHKKGPNVWIDSVFGAGSSRGNFWPPEVGDSVWVKFAQGDPAKPVVYLGGWFGEEDVPTEFAYSSSGTPRRRGWITRGGHQLIFNDEPGSESVRIVWHRAADDDEARTDVRVSAARTAGDLSFVGLEPDGSIQIVNKNGSMVNIDATNGAISIIQEDGNSVNLTSDGVSAVDKNGNLVSVSGDVTLVSNDNVQVVGQTINLKGGSLFLGDNAEQAAVLGNLLLLWLGTHTHTTPAGPSGVPIVLPPETLVSQSVRVKS